MSPEDLLEIGFSNIHTFHIDKPLDYTLYANANVFDNRPNQ